MDGIDKFLHALGIGGRERPVTFATLCSGIGCAELAAEPLGLVPLFRAEIDRFANAVAAAHWPHVPNLGDMTLLAAQIRAGGLDRLLPDVLIAGSPCQSFSIAGLGKSLDDPRGQLTLELVNILNAIDERRATRGRRTAIPFYRERNGRALRPFHPETA